VRLSSPSRCWRARRCSASGPHSVEQGIRDQPTSGMAPMPHGLLIGALFASSAVAWWVFLLALTERDGLRWLSVPANTGLIALLVAGYLLGIVRVLRRPTHRRRALPGRRNRQDARYPESSTNSPCAIACKRSCSPTSPDSCSPATPPPEDPRSRRSAPTHAIAADECVNRCGRTASRPGLGAWPLRLD
jgi:hypothetical protein